MRLPRTFRAAALAAAGLSACSTAPVPQEQASRDYKVDSQDVFYDIGGATSAQIAAELDKHALVRKDGRWTAETRWNLSTRYAYREPEAGGCRTSDMQVKISLQTELPRWKAPAAAPGELAEQWRSFEAKVRLHEKGHYDNGLQAAGEVTAGLRDLTAHDCKELLAAADRLIAGIVSRHEAIDADYDAKTRHGVLQGMVWRIEASR